MSLDMDKAADALYGAGAAPASKPAATQRSGRDEIDTEAAAQALYGSTAPAARKPAANSNERKSDEDSENPWDNDPAGKLYSDTKEPELDEHGYIKRPDDKDSTEEPKDGEDKNGQKAKEDAPAALDIKVPEGMTVDQQALGEFAPVAKELKLTADQAQKLADVHIKTLQRQHEERVKTFTEWRRESEKQFDTLEMFDARDFFKACNDPELDKMLAWSGLGNHPSVIRAFSKAGALLRRLRA